jgi:hypothetical protein
MGAVVSSEAISAAIRDHDPLDPWLTESHYDERYWNGEAAEIAKALQPEMSAADVRLVVIDVLTRRLPSATAGGGVDEWRTARLNAIAGAIWHSLGSEQREPLATETCPG